MADAVIRPTAKKIRIGYTVAATLIFIAVFVYNNYLPEDTPNWPIFAIASALLFWPTFEKTRRRFTTVRIAGDKFSYGAGFFSKNKCTIQLTKIREISVTQSLIQKFLDIGDLQIEVDGEPSQLRLADFDDPQETASQLMEMVASKQPVKRRGEKA